MWLHFRDHHEISVFLWKPCNNTSSDNVIEVWELFKHYLKITAVMRQRKCRTKSLELNPGIHVGSISPSGSLDFFASLFHNIVKHLISALDVLTQMWSMSADSTEAKISYMKEQIEKRVSNYSACTGTVGFGLKEKEKKLLLQIFRSQLCPQSTGPCRLTADGGDISNFFSKAVGSRRHSGYNLWTYSRAGWSGILSGHTHTHTDMMRVFKS